ncbi:hypothetical protein JI739_10755 [Ramlibacter sp. AW1]|uniref:Uncharacterized protein n=1 Tax=Ramlibacter aurantiacus TaxID=2801330 RepID=A0A936ZUH6_9BURK|nr:hypothetical protein [Ramlibacter aurantiacus]MBL0420824.1 hypothetical protein [Ramlibacter aurantiacus]
MTSRSCESRAPTQAWGGDDRKAGGAAEGPGRRAGTQGDDEIGRTATQQLRKLFAGNRKIPAQKFQEFRRQYAQFVFTEAGIKDQAQEAIRTALDVNAAPRSAMNSWDIQGAVDSVVERLVPGAILKDQGLLAPYRAEAYATRLVHRWGGVDPGISNSLMRDVRKLALVNTRGLDASVIQAMVAARISESTSRQARQKAAAASEPGPAAPVRESKAAAPVRPSAPPLPGKLGLEDVEAYVSRLFAQAAERGEIGPEDVGRLSRRVASDIAVRSGGVDMSLIQMRVRHVLTQIAENPGGW